MDSPGTTDDRTINLDLMSTERSAGGPPGRPFDAMAAPVVGCFHLVHLGTSRRINNTATPPEIVGTHDSNPFGCRTRSPVD